MNVIETNNLFKIYEQGEIEVRALDDVSINFKQGEFTAIVGPSGSGKTTFLNAIGGLDTPTSGNVRIHDTDITELNSNEHIDFFNTFSTFFTSLNFSVKFSLMFFILSSKKFLYSTIDKYLNIFFLLFLIFINVLL